MIGCKSHSEKAKSSCYLGSYLVVTFDCEDISCLEDKTNWKKTFIIGCMSRPENSTKSSYLENINF